MVARCRFTRIDTQKISRGDGQYINHIDVFKHERIGILKEDKRTGKDKKRLSQLVTYGKPCQQKSNRNKNRNAGGKLAACNGPEFFKRMCAVPRRIQQVVKNIVG